uniref:Uncharacterized protein n=1 Tax=Oryza sativa subsp. japonica TaxID=39947 RepID=Q6H4E0_ORYSJ|nr:hypothetical protein [Oryza sativa Japonica Group]BAD26409.1 hypothetical protein [Oryza sativa Japonica Group]
MGLADSGVNFVWVVGDKNASASLLPVERQRVTLLASESALRLMQQPISPPNSLARSLAGLRHRRSAKSGARRSTTTAKGPTSSRLGRSSALSCPLVGPATSAGKTSVWTRIRLPPLPPVTACLCLSVARDERGER